MKRTPAPPKPLTMTLRTVVEPAATTSPSLDAPAAVPLISTSGALVKPDCVAPSIQTGSVMTGSALDGAIVTIGDAPAGMANWIKSAPALAFAARIAPRKLHPEASQVVPSLVLVTVNVA